MKPPIHILHLEDNRKDAEIVQSTLEAADIYCATIWVRSHDEFVAALEQGGIDLILSDYTLPGFDGLSALKIARAKWPATPFVFVSGTMSEERAIESLKSGATDYILKERMARLAPAVRRAMQEVADRAERLRLEAQFVEAQKMEILARLAGGVAHDFNNIIGVIMSYSDLTIQALGHDEVLKRYVAEIHSAAERAVGLTRQLLIFSRKQTIQPSVLDLNVVTQGLGKMLRRLLDENIEMTIVPGKEIGRIKADAGYIEQVLMNLVVNARDAMPHGGKITIATNNVTLDESYARTHPGASPGNNVMFSVSDSGSGMTDEVKSRMFEAFFTTKPEGKGTGLGLATCQTVVQQFGGHICIESEVGQGTTFKIYFPRVELALDVKPKPQRAGPLPRGTETLLLVEDDPALRHLTCDALKAQGYDVLRASNGQEGLRAARELNGQPIALVITNVVMPIMGGKVMAEWLKTSHPDLKFLFTSGYPDDALTGMRMLKAGSEFLPKPYTAAALVRKVRQMIDASPTQVAS